jgi:release factor glutamine methyltransferase
VDSGSYRPLMSPQRVERIRHWHTGAYRELRARADNDQTFPYLGRTLVVPAQVMPIGPMSHLLGEAVLSEVTEADRVLDMGTGCGVNAILAASRSSEVMAVDINPMRWRRRETTPCAMVSPTASRYATVTCSATSTAHST